MYSPEEREAWIKYFEEGGKEVSKRDGYRVTPEHMGLTSEQVLEGLRKMNEAGNKLKPTDNPFREKVQQVLYPLEDLLVEKNESYGNSALEPINVFSKASAVDQIKVRIDDKLNRLYHGKEYGDEDTVTDLLGYLVILKIAEKEIH